MCLFCSHIAQGVNGMLTHSENILFLLYDGVPLKLSFITGMTLHNEKYEEIFCPLRIARALSMLLEKEKHKYFRENNRKRSLHSCIVGIWSEKDIKRAIFYHQDEKERKEIVKWVTLHLYRQILRYDVKTSIH